MNAKQLVRLSNIIGVIAIILLIYWVFTFITIQVFGLKVFRENITETFYMSILGILALMAGALIMNIMFNLTRIAEKHNHDAEATIQSKKLGWVLLITFPVLLFVLFGGDYLTSRKKEKLLVQSAEAMISTQPKKTEQLLNYQFTDAWILETEKVLQILSETDDNFNNVSLIVKDNIDGDPVFLGFKSHYNGNLTDTIPPKKISYIQTTTQEEREYLNKVFQGSIDEYRYSAHDGRYELFYPCTKGPKKVVLYFSEYRRYGKIGS